MLKVAVLSIGFPNFRYDLGQQLVDRSLVALKTVPTSNQIEWLIIPNIVIDQQKILHHLQDLSTKQPDLLVLLLGTYSYGDAVLHCIDLLPTTHLMLWAYREPQISEPQLALNSLCALNMYTSFFYRMQFTNFSCLYGNPGEAALQQQLENDLAAAAAKKALQSAKFAVVGGSVPGFYRSQVDLLRYHKQVGAEIVEYSLAQLLADAESFGAEPVAAAAQRIAGAVARCDTAACSLEHSARILLALEQLRHQQQIDGFALKCWPELQSLYQMAPCALMALLADSGTPAACEGDITGLTSLYLLSQFSASTPLLTDLVNISTDGTIKLWHCGVAPPSLAADPAQTFFGEHPTIRHNIGIGGSFSLRPGRVTVCKLSEDDPYKLFLFEGQAVVPDRPIAGNQVDIIPDVPAETLLQGIVEHGIEHHYALGYDVSVEALKTLCSRMGIRVIAPN